MSKPIFLIQCPRFIPKDEMETIFRHTSKRLTDWHVLIINSPTLADFEFTAFSEQGASEVEIENLKEMLLNQIGIDGENTEVTLANTKTGDRLIYTNSHHRSTERKEYEVEVINVDDVITVKVINDEDDAKSYGEMEFISFDNLRHKR